MAFLAPLFAMNAIPFLLRKISNDEELQKLNINTLKIQNNCGTLLTLAEKIEVQTQEDITDYHAHKAQNGNILLCFVSPQLQMVGCTKCYGQIVNGQVFQIQTFEETAFSYIKR